MLKMREKKKSRKVGELEEAAPGVAFAPDIREAEHVGNRNEPIPVQVRHAGQAGPTGPAEGYPQDHAEGHAQGYAAGFARGLAQAQAQAQAEEQANPQVDPDAHAKVEAQAGAQSQQPQGKGQGAVEMQEPLPGYHIHFSTNPMWSVNAPGYQGYFLPAGSFPNLRQPTVGGNVTVIGQTAQPCPVVVPQQAPQPVLYTTGAPVVTGNVFGGGPCVIPAPGIPGGGPPMLVNSQQPGNAFVGNATPGNISGVYTGQPGHIQMYNAAVPNINFPPDITGIGRTAGEVAAQQAHLAVKDEIYKPQDFKPADDDPSRFYPVRELDGNWTQRNRITIDNLDCRWYLHADGYFYAVRLSD